MAKKEKKEVVLNVDQAMNELKVTGLLRRVFSEEFKEFKGSKTQWVELLKREGYNV